MKCTKCTRSEANIKRAIRAYLELKRCVVVPVRNVGIMQKDGSYIPLPARRPRGMSDLIVCLADGRLAAIEVKKREIHVVLDNLSAHKTKTVETFLADHPHVRLRFTPTYSSWLNQVELWFSKIQRDVISRGVFTSVADLARKLKRYIRLHAKIAKPSR